MELPVMTKLLDQHRIIEAVTVVIERETATIEAGNAPDFGLLRLALEYLRDFSEWRHHPVEEHLFGEAIRKDPVLLNSLKVVMGEHDALPAETTRILALIDDLEQDFAARRKAAADALHLYVQGQRKHIHREDRDIFPRLRGLLDRRAWLLPSTEPENDPLADDGDGGRFAPLRRAAGL